MYYNYSDPSFVAPLPGNITKVARSIAEEIARQKVLREAGIETGRLRELERQKAELFPIVTELEPGSEVSNAFYEGVEGKEYTHRFPMRPRRAERREAKGLPGYREARPVSTFTPQDLAEMREQQEKSWAEQVAARKAREEAEFEAELPFRVAERNYPEDTPITRYTPRGPEYHLTDIATSQRRTGGRGGGSGKDDDLRDITSADYRWKRDNFGDEVMNQFTQPGEDGKPVIDPVGNLYMRAGQLMLGAQNQQELQEAYQKGRQALDNIASGGPITRAVMGDIDLQEVQKAITYLEGAYQGRARLFDVYGQRQETEPTVKPTQQTEGTDWTKYDR